MASELHTASMYVIFGPLSFLKIKLIEKLKID